MTETSNATGSITEIHEVPKIDFHHQLNRHGIACKVNQQQLVFFQSITPPFSHHFNSMAQKWTTTTDDGVVHNAVALHRKIDIALKKIQKHIDDITPDHGPPQILPVPSKNMILVFFEGTNLLPIPWIGRFDVNSEEFEATRIGSNIRSVPLWTRTMVLSSNGNYVVIIYTVPHYNPDHCAFISVLDIRNADEYTIWDSELRIDHLLPENWKYFECLLRGPTNNTPFVRLWMDNMLRQQEFKEMEIAEIIISLIGGYYAEPIIHLLQNDRTNERCRHWLLSEKAILKSNHCVPMVNGIGMVNGSETKIKWPEKGVNTQ